MLRVPCLTLRENTERPITITQGTNTLVGFDHHRIVSAALAALAGSPAVPQIERWDGRACERIVDVLTRPAFDCTFIPPILRVGASDEFRAGREPCFSRPDLQPEQAPAIHPDHPPVAPTEWAA